MSLKEEWIEVAGLRAISVGDPASARAVMVMLHGFQMEPADLSPFAHSMSMPVWFLFPEGPLAAQPRGRAWWHIDAALREQALARGPRDFAVQNPPDLPAARSRLIHFIEELAPHLEGRPLVLGGFSQGGMLVCDTVRRSALSISAMVLLSASRIAWEESHRLSSERLRGLPTLITHGRSDTDLAFAAGEALRDHLVEAGAQVDWLDFDQGHEIPLVVWRRIRKFLNAISAGSR